MSEYLFTWWQAMTYDPSITSGVFAFYLALTASIVCAAKYIAKWIGTRAARAAG
jgi:hypothetical protein